MSSLSLLTLDRGIEFSMVKSISGSVKDSRLGNQGFRMLLLSMFSHNFLTPGQSLAQSTGVEGKNKIKGKQKLEMYFKFVNGGTTTIFLNSMRFVY